MTFVLGKKSHANLEGVHPVMQDIVKMAIGITTVDFTVFEGVRTLERQRKLLATGATKTLKSAHIPVPDLSGKTKNVLGHAVDLVPIIDGQPRWEWGLIYSIAAAMSAAAVRLGTASNLCWGGAWGVWMSSYIGDAHRMRKEVVAYQARHPGPDFIDGTHFQVFRLS